jgi:hypothetical protein
MGDGELIRKVIGRPRPPWKSEAEFIKWIKAQYAELGLRGPLHDDAGKVIDYITDEDDPRDATEKNP